MSLHAKTKSYAILMYASKSGRYMGRK